jgi:proline dehydrogenase
MTEIDHHRLALEDFKQVCRDHRLEDNDRFKTLQKEVRDDCKDFQKQIHDELKEVTERHYVKANQLEVKLADMVTEIKSELNDYLKDYEARLCSEKAKNERLAWVSYVLTAVVSGAIVLALTYFIKG